MFKVLIHPLTGSRHNQPDQLTALAAIEEASRSAGSWPGPARRVLVFPPTVQKSGVTAPRGFALR